MGRTGAFFAYELAGVTPMSWRLPRVSGRFSDCGLSGHGRGGIWHGAGCSRTTFGGNPLADGGGQRCARRCLEDGFLEHVQQMGLLFRQGLAGLKDRYPDVIEEIRGEAS